MCQTDLQWGAAAEDSGSARALRWPGRLGWTGGEEAQEGGRIRTHTAGSLLRTAGTNAAV